MTKDFPCLSLRGKRQYVHSTEIISAMLQYLSPPECESSQFEIIFRKAVTSPVIISNNNSNSEALVVIRQTIGSSTQEYYLLPTNGTLKHREDVFSIKEFSLFERGFTLHSASQSLEQFLSDYFHVAKKWYLKYKHENAPVVRKIRFDYPINEVEQTVTFIQDLRKGYDRLLVYSDKTKRLIIEIQACLAKPKVL